MALDYTALGKRISTFRNASGLTQEQFCEKLNVSRKHISQIEAAISRPSLETLVDIANIVTGDGHILTGTAKGDDVHRRQVCAADGGYISVVLHLWQTFGRDPDGKGLDLAAPQRSDLLGQKTA